MNKRNNPTIWQRLSNAFIRIVSSRNSSKDWMFEGEFKYNFQFKISMPINEGYRETGIINVVVPANSSRQAKSKLNKFVKEKMQVTVVNMKQC